MDYSSGRGWISGAPTECAGEWASPSPPPVAGDDLAFESYVNFSPEPAVLPSVSDLPTRKNTDRDAAPLDFYRPLTTPEPGLHITDHNGASIVLDFAVGQEQDCNRLSPLRSQGIRSSSHPVHTLQLAAQPSSATSETGRTEDASTVDEDDTLFSGNGGDLTINTAFSNISFTSASDAIKKHSCNHPGCNKSFKLPSDLTKHQRIHVPYEKRPFACKEVGCSARSLYRKDLKRHMYTHVKSSFICKRCSKFFKREDHLKRHQLLHDPSPTPSTSRKKSPARKQSPASILGIKPCAKPNAAAKVKTTATSDDLAQESGMMFPLYAFDSGPAYQTPQFPDLAYHIDPLCEQALDVFSRQWMNHELWSLNSTPSTEQILPVMEGAVQQHRDRNAARPVHGHGLYTGGDPSSSTYLSGHESSSYGYRYI